MRSSLNLRARSIGGNTSDSRDARWSICGMKRIEAASSLVCATRALLLGDRTRGGFAGPWVGVGSRGFGMVPPTIPVGTAESLRRALDGLFETTPEVLDSSADGSEATRESPLMPLTVGNHALEAVLLSGPVEHWRGGCADAGGDEDSTGGAMWLKIPVWWMVVVVVVVFDDALVGVTVGAAGRAVLWPWPWPWV